MHNEIVLPFCGFYNSIHDGNIDNAIEYIFQMENGDTIKPLAYRLYNQCNFSEVFKAYAMEYSQQFAAAFELPSLVFKFMQSPKEYNFTTDRIFCTISDDDIEKMRANTSPLTLEKHARESFTSRDGFSSFYSPDYNTWGDVSEWDHNQLACLLEAYIEDFTQADYDQWAECALMESAQCNGYFDSWIADNTKGINRLYKIADYVRTREERAHA